MLLQQHNFNLLQQKYTPAHSMWCKKWTLSTWNSPRLSQYYSQPAAKETKVLCSRLCGGRELAYRLHLEGGGKYFLVKLERSGGSRNQYWPQCCLTPHK